ncbi:MAG: metallopeptidase family protein [Mycobacteriales bacterium]
MIDVPTQRFEELVADALDSVPEPLMRLLDNVAIFAVDQHPDNPRLLGLYEGVALTRRTHEYAGAMPDHISIYRLPILRICATEDQVVNEVRVTVVHEIAHHFGISDERLHELGWG